MNKKIVISVLLIIMVLALSIGATYAWFTDELVLENEFKAGTLKIDGWDKWYKLELGEDWKDVNPGDCKDKEIEIENTGSKNVLLRFKVEGKWLQKYGDSWVLWSDGDTGLVTFAVPNDWTLHNGYYYYSKRLEPGDVIKSSKFKIKFCLDGEGTGNEYQDKRYKIFLTFDAIQASNNASGAAWGVPSTYYSNNQAADQWTGFDFPASSD